MGFERLFSRGFSRFCCFHLLLIFMNIRKLHNFSFLCLKVKKRGLKIEEQGAEEKLRV